MAGTSRPGQDRHSLLLALVKDIEQLEAQGARIKELRKQARKSQLDVANHVHVTPRGYQAWEAGASDPKPHNLKRLANYLGTTPDYIRYGVIKRQRPDRAQTPAPFASRDQLDRIEQKLDVLRAMLTLLAAGQAIDVSTQVIRQSQAELAEADPPVAA